MLKNIQGIEGFALMEIHNIMVENSPFKRGTMVGANIYSEKIEKYSKTY